MTSVDVDLRSGRRSESIICNSSFRWFWKL